MSTADLEHELLALADATHREKTARPSNFYEPHGGQVAFHKSTHRVRALFPGNRWGKTTAMATECNWWLTHRHPYQRTPSHPAVIVWIAPQFRQFDILRAQLELECLDAGWEFNGSDNVYRWPDGGEWWIVPADRNWTYVQGINPDLIAIDEECPLPLWRELRARAAGRERQSRYIVGATATMGETWMETEIYRPWLEHHHLLGLDEDSAMGTQSHPSIFCWPKGSITENPGLSGSSKSDFMGLTWASAKEAKVRQGGGFSSWLGDPVFDEVGMLWLRSRRLEIVRECGLGVTGALEVTQ